MDNFAATFEQAWLNQHLRWCDQHDLNGAIAFSHPWAKITYFHRVAKINVTASEVDCLIDDAIQLFNEKDFPCIFTVSPLDRPNDLPERLTARGFREGAVCSAMHHHQGAPLPKPNGPIEIQLADSHYDDWATIMCRSFDVSSDKADVGRHVLQTLEDRHYLATVDGVPAGCTLLHLRDGIGYIDFVGVAPEFRRQGIASALVARAVADSEKSGAETTILETAAGSAAERLYSRLGFRAEYHRRRFIRNR